jgi:hypothetical protein
LSAQGHYPRLCVEPEADFDYVAFGDPGGADGRPDADNDRPPMAATRLRQV